jgi:CheY-like chemotaxis protein
MAALLRKRALMINTDRRGPTILVVEDIGWIRASMKKSVERCGYHVMEAADDAEAFEVAEQESIVLILTEEELPTFDALMARLHEHPSFHSVPVVIINPDAEEGARHGEAFLLTNYDSIAALLASPRG